MTDEIEVETKDLQETIDELREEREEREKDAKETRWTRFISLSTALLAVVAAIGAMRAGGLVNEAVIVKSDAVLQQAKASDAWSYYQAKGIKSATAGEIADLLKAAPTLSRSATALKTEALKQKKEQAPLMKQATDLEKERDEKNAEALALLKRHEMFAWCVMFMQVAISLSAIAALTKNKSVWYMSMALGAVGTALFIAGFVLPLQSGHHDAKPEGIVLLQLRED